MVTYRPHAHDALMADLGGGVVRKLPDATSGVAGGFGQAENQHDDDTRGIAFTSAPLETPLEITGRPVVTLAVGHEPAAARTLVVKLTEVDLEGRSSLITSGVIRKPESAAAIDVELYCTSFEVPAGHRVRVVVASGDFPRLWPDPYAAELAVDCAGTSLRLPVTREPSKPVTMPEPEVPLGAPLVLREDPRYTVTRDHTTGGVRVDVGVHLVADTPDGLGRLDTQQVVSATVSPHRPSAARVTGRSTSTIQVPVGEFIVTAELLVNGQAAVASGTVTWDGQEIFSRRWVS